ncbi:MAG: DUF3959 family protein [Ectobacillus sp.]
MKKLDVLLMLLSLLFPVAGIMNQIPLQLSLFMGGLLFITSFGSYFAKRMNSRIFSWAAYTAFIVFLLSLWNQYVTTDSLVANVKVAACIAAVPFLFRFRTYAITIGLLGLWGAVLWDVKEAQSLAVLQRMMHTIPTERLYVFALASGFLLGGWLGNITTPKEWREKANKAKRKKKSRKLTIPMPSLPKLKIKIWKFGRKSSAPQKIRPHEPAYEEHIKTVNMEQTSEPEPPRGQTRMERRKNRYRA